ncbi:hypothetical protein [Micromonospora sp. NPDC005113]
MTASDVNTYLMKQAVITCTSGARPTSPVEGMTIYETDTDTLLGYSGSAWVVLIYLTRPLAQLRQTSTQSIASGTWAAIGFQAEDHDTVNGHSTSSNVSRYTAQKAGRYEISGAVCFALAATGSMWARWAVNGGELNGSATNMATTTAQTLLAARTLLITLAVGDYVELQGTQFSGGSLSTYVADGYAQSTMTVKWVSA